MYTLLLSLALGMGTYALVAVLFDPIAAIVPAIMAFGIALVVVLLRVKRRVDDAMGGIVPLLQERRIADAQAHLEGLRKQWARWMPLLDGQVDAQLGMIDYYQLKFDAALPKLQKGQWRNFMALGCIGAIHFRKGRRKEAFEALAKAVKVAPKEPLAYVLHAVLAHRAGDDDKALEVLRAGVAAIPDNKQLQDLSRRVANKKKIDAAALGESWVQFFPEDMVAQQHIAARKGTPLPGPGFRGPGVTKQQRRGR